MRKITHKFHSTIVSITALFAFSFWNVVSINRGKIERILNISTKAPFLGEVVLGAILSYGVYKILYKLLSYLCNRFSFLKLLFYRSMYFEGKWCGGQFYNNELRLHIVTIEQDFDVFEVSGSVYSVEGKYLGNMHYESVSFNFEKKLYFSTYTANSVNRDHPMDGLARGGYSLDRHRQPNKLEIYTVQSGVAQKQTMVCYKIPRNIHHFNDRDLITYINNTYQEKFIGYLTGKKKPDEPDDKEQKQ